jgi:hypothetical protein
MDDNKIKTDGYITLKIDNDKLIDNIINNYKIDDILELQILHSIIKLKIYHFELINPILNYVKKSLKIKGEIIKE